MSHILIRHRVTDWATWKPAFDDHGGMRSQSGSKGGVVFRSDDDPNEVIVLLEWDSLDKARAFAQSPDLRAVMERAGVADQPDVYFLEEADRVAE